MSQMVCAQVPPFQKTGKKHKKSGRTTRVIDEPHLEFTRSGPCCVCGKPGPSHPHHVKHRGSGGSDRQVVPLCPRHHTEVHMSREKFAETHGIDLDAEAAYVWGISPANPTNANLAQRSAI